MMSFKRLFFGLSVGLPLFFYSLGLQCQSIRNQSWVSMGTVAVPISTSNHLFVQQSSGQSSVTGVFGGVTTRVSQGFLRGIRSNPSEIHPPFEAIAFPNSFSEKISFRFTTAPSYPTLVQLYDAQGRMVYEGDHLPSNKEIHLTLPFLASGVYVAHLKSGKKFVQLRIIKKP